MNQTPQLETVFRQWESGTIAEWTSVQENMAQVMLTDGQRFVFKKLGAKSTEKIGRLHFEYTVLRHVEQIGLPVALPLLSKESIPYALAENQLYRLSKWLSNNPTDIRTKADSVQLYRNYGMAIGRFHQALASIKEDKILRQTWHTDLQQRVLGEAVPTILTHLEQPDLHAFQTLLSNIKSAMIEAFTDLPRQLIIWDCHPGNITVNGFEVSGFIDCDHISIAPRIFDLANFLVHLIKWDVGNQQKKADWLVHFRQLIIGYETTMCLSKEERTAVFYAMVGIPLIFMDFFLQNNMPKSIKVELDLFAWLVGQRQEIMAQLEGDL